MKITNSFVGGIAAIGLSGVLLLGGCSDQRPASPTAQVDRTEIERADTAPRSPMSDLRSEPLPEPYRANQDMTYTSSDSMVDERNRDLADRELSPMTLPELQTRVGEVQNKLADLRPRAERHNELDDFEDLQERTQEVAQKIQEAVPQVDPDDREEMTEEILEVEAEIAEFDNELSEDL